MKNKIIGICGGSASGKTTIAKKLAKLLPEETNILSLDNYYKNFSGLVEELSRVNYDRPESLDLAYFIEHVKNIRSGKSINVPQYDYALHSRRSDTKLLIPKKLTIIEGLFLFNINIPSEFFDLKIYVDTPSDIRFIRRLVRDREERDRSVESIVNQYLGTVRPMHDIYVAPNKTMADKVLTGMDYTEDDLLRLFVEITN